MARNYSNDFGDDGYRSHSVSHCLDVSLGLGLVLLLR